MATNRGIDFMVVSRSLKIKGYIDALLLENLEQDSFDEIVELWKLSNSIYGNILVWDSTIPLSEKKLFLGYAKKELVKALKSNERLNGRGIISKKEYETILNDFLYLILQFGKVDLLLDKFLSNVDKEKL